MPSRLALLLTLLLVAAASLAPPSAQAAATFTVNSTADPGDGVCDAVQCTLREAINAANANLGTDTIAFNIPGAGPHTIQPTSALPSITDPVVIDGYTQPGANPNTNGPGLGLNTVLRIELDGSNAGAGVAGLHIWADGSIVRGLVINRFNASGAGGGISITAHANVIEGNFIGTDATGTIDLGITTNGVFVNGANNTIGGTTANARNVISGNTVGVLIQGGGATSNLVQGNLIGTDANGTGDLGNSEGIVILSANNTIGGSSPGARNIISGNGPSPGAGRGVVIAGNATGNLVQGNFIGTDVNGTANLGNTRDGINITAPSNNTTIGGTANGAGNTIAFNGGLAVVVSSGTGNAILGNSIFSNGGLGIDLGPTAGVTPNDPADADTGANNLQNFPVLTSATGGGTSIKGSLHSAPNTTFRLEFFANAACDPSGFGEGQTFLGFLNAVTDGAHNAVFSVLFPVAVPVGHFITATATDPAGNTSEFSGCLQAQAAPTTPIPGVSGPGLAALAALLAVASACLLWRRRRPGPARS
jgi:CSLREA domain-containing protein